VDRAAWPSKRGSSLPTPNSEEPLFVYHYLTMKTERDLPIGNLFEEFRIWWQGEDGDVATFLADLRRYATLYRDITLPTGSDRMSIPVGESVGAGYEHPAPSIALPGWA
jgi:hypothetical protein